MKPRFRGVSHGYAFFAALAAGATLVALAPTGRAAAAATIYVLTLAGLFGTSALYHRIDWGPRTRRWMRRLDHSMIFLLVAGTYTPFGLLVFTGTLGTAILVVVWAGALGGVALSMLWPDAPPWVNAGVYFALGWVGLAGMPQIVDHAGIGALALIVVGGALYTTGGVIYALRRPDPRPAAFGYHEIFHVLVIAAAVLHFVAVAAYAVN